MKSKFFCAVALAVFGLTALAAANTVPVTFTSTTSGLGGPGQGVYYYPYQLIVNGSSVTVACDDYADTVHLGESWLASVNTFADLSHTLFFNSAGVGLYQQAAWLYSQFLPTPPLQDNVNAAINFAMWDLFDGSAPGFNTSNPTSTTSSKYWLNLAATQNLSGFDFSQFVIYTPVSGWPSNDGRPQEYIGEVPEPGTVLLFMTGLLGLAGLAWRRRMLAE
ncbi:MAG TPA: PEP-CTERM sorting domain-containing protein [Terriglobales bacterium]|nr:PEP-CTERM sorting domain-containing protein [Terriglobales bacterium]